MAADSTLSKWNCSGCTFENDSAQNPDRCAVCNTPKDYLSQAQKSKDGIIKKYKEQHGDELLSFFYPYPDTKGCNSGDTAVHCILDDQLYLSGSFRAQDMTWLKDNKIGAILNCASTDIKHSDDTYTKQNGIILKQLPIHDSTKWQSTMKEYIQESIQFIDDCIHNKKIKILVHCSAGISRSSTVVIAYLMERNQWDLLQSFKYVRDKRKYIYPNLGFWQLLIEMNNEKITEKIKGNGDDKAKDEQKEHESVSALPSERERDVISMDILCVHAEQLGKMHGTMYSAARTEKVSVKLW